jgi:hypothetical protein
MTQSSVIPFGEAPLSILRQGIPQTSSSFWQCEATPPVKLARITRLVKRVAHPEVLKSSYHGAAIRVKLELVLLGTAVPAPGGTLANQF